ncbi:hypothetical protein BDP27DRAFT_1431048 [Rhodocollybia butyracea]|uniref:G-patch domain-containing protein n=1 Tax=Rhodocollybia butyracea TaxID=206335 RepID=A0A9P5PCF0_9AGAR|nr:hypothetical protein BDP27DRAFT_1431048 [Rhodocollybia butyracea]
MTSRLKKKLGDIGVDTSSTRANENFCLIGTPLPPLEKSRDTGEFVPLWKQEVRDEKGRRRLHGAFTGGFSAGYFNTVGSKEGLMDPQTFVSSRSDRATKKATKPEDFMDEEDLQDIRDSRKIVDTTDELDLASGAQAEGQDQTGVDPLTTALQSAMLPPSKDSVGARILKKMGWRVGQGIGPRITFKQRRLQDLQASGSLSAGTDMDTSLDEESEEANKHTYAPRDTPVLIVERKDNSHGLGYRSGMSLNERLGAKGGGGSTSMGPKIASGFGLGALNDADEDDLDIYEGGSSNLRSRLAYDAADDHDGETISLGKPKSNLKPVAGPSTTTHGTFRDGRAVLPGFLLSAQSVMEDRWYPLPDIPPGWKPDPKRVWSQSQGQANPDKENVKQNDSMPQEKWKASKLSAAERGSILGETPLPSAPRSVFDFMSQKDRERLQNIAASLLSSHPLMLPPRCDNPHPRTDPQIARAALGGFQPFPSNPVKQARYRAYLQSQANVDSEITLAPLPHQSIAEFNSEMEEYSQSAIVFKPMSGAMAGRFTSAAVVEHGPKVVEGLHTPSFTESKDSDAEQKEKEKEPELSPKEHAVRIGMYGSLTREVKPWQPAKLLCKRFGVKDPNPEPTTEPDPSTHPQDPTSSAFDSSAATPSMADIGIITSSNVGGAGSGGPRDLANVGLGDDDETQGRDTLTYERPSVDVFKAIFASDDEDSTSSVSAPVVVPSAVAPSLAPAPPDDQVVDINTFKPTFVRREARMAATIDSEKKEKKERKEKKEKKKRKVTVSFLDGDDEGGDSLNVVVEKPKKKRKKDKERGKEKETKVPATIDDDDMWVEKQPVTGQVSHVDSEMTNSTPQGAAATEMPKGRKRAVDFL